MNQKEYEKKLSELDSNDRKALARIFGNSIRKVEDIGRSFSNMTQTAKGKIAKSVGAVALAVLIGAGMTACDKEDVKPPVETTETENNYTNDTTDNESESTETPGTETPGTETPGTETPGTETPGTETPGTETSGTETPGTETPGTETPGAETPGTETPGTETPGTETPGTETPGTETPGTETPGTETPGTETPGTETPGTETPGVNDDLPGDADGFQYGGEIAAKVHNEIVNGALKDTEKKYALSQKEESCEILFVELGEANYDNDSPVFVYAAYPISETKKVFLKFEFDVPIRTYDKLKRPANFETYTDFATLLAEAVWKGTCVNAWESEATNLHNMTEEETTKLAAIIDEKFVNVDVNFVKTIKHDEYGWCYEVCGFAYDIEEKPYSYICYIQQKMDYGFWNQFLQAVESGELTINDMPGVSTQKVRIDSVFQASSEIEAEE